MNLWLFAAGLAGACLIASWLGTRLLLDMLRRRAILDRPNERSSHVTPTPRGGGLAVIATLTIAWSLGAVLLPMPGMWLVLLGALGLAVVSWRDDLGGVAAAWRLLAQVAAVGIGLLALQPLGPVFQGIVPPSLDALLAGLLWLWFVNLFNFMDGIDGIAGAETASIGTGIVVLAAFSLGLPSAALWGATAVSAALGFLYWNWDKAEVFLGDVGSIPLGYLLGWLLLATAAAGQWEAALILPLYYVADASLTLIRRLLRGKRIWRAHREHYYQRAVQRGLSHAAVVKRILACNVLLIVLAVGAGLGLGWRALPIAGAVTFVLISMLAGRSARSS
jgi:UDP-N-acetylmuramyl pentapeptide phosphotransferase/UDP-N-acetylglucosamine-1-phosphate transferase